MKPLFGNDVERIERQIENPVKYYIRHNMGGSTGGEQSGKIFVKDAATGKEEEVEKIECLLLAVRYKGLAIRPSDKLTAYTSFEKKMKGNNNISLFFRSPGTKGESGKFQLRGNLSQLENHLASNAFPNPKISITNVLYVFYKGGIAQLETSGGDTAKFIEHSKSAETPFFSAFQDKPEGLNYWLTFRSIPDLKAEDYAENPLVLQLRDYLNESDEISAQYIRDEEQ